jgi:hypothetical protein
MNTELPTQAVQPSLSPSTGVGISSMPDLAHIGYRLFLLFIALSKISNYIVTGKNSLYSQ